MGISVDSKEVSINLTKFIVNGLPNTIEDCLNDACLIIESDAKINCPSDTSRLRRSIESKVDGDEGCVFTNVEYAPYVEIGTGIYSTKGSGRQTPWKYQDGKGKWHTTKGMRSQPYLKPALDNNTQRVINCFEEKI